MYTSKDAYNGCLSLFSKEEAAHRGYISRLKISGDVSKTETGYEIKISRIHCNSKRGMTTHVAQKRPSQLPSLIDDRLDATHSESYLGSNSYYEDYMIPRTVDAKIVITTDYSLFCSQKIQFNVVLQLSNLDFNDLVKWPPLTSSISMKHNADNCESCSVSLGESWSLCDTSSEFGSEAGGDWELVSMEAIGDELQQMSMLGTDEAVGNSNKVNKRSYADIVKMTPPKKRILETSHVIRKQCTKKWSPVYKIEPVSRMDRKDLVAYLPASEYYEGSDNDGDCDIHAAAYESMKSFGTDARTSMLIANEAYTRKKFLGIIPETTRLKSVK